MFPAHAQIAVPVPLRSANSVNHREVKVQVRGTRPYHQKDTVFILGPLKASAIHAHPLHQVGVIPRVHRVSTRGVVRSSSTREARDGIGKVVLLR